MNVKYQECAVFTGTKYVIKRGLRVLVEYCCTQLFAATFTESQIDQITASGVTVAWNGATVPWSELPTSLAPTRDAESLPVDFTTAMCERSLPQLAVQPPRQPSSAKRRCTRSSPKKKEERAPSPLTVETPGEPYDIRSIGGIEVDVREAHAARPVWDAEIVLEMLRHGAHPPLKNILSVVSRRHYRDAECIFIQPSGAETPSIFIPMSIILSEYREMATQYVR